MPQDFETINNMNVHFEDSGLKMSDITSNVDTIKGKVGEIRKIVE